MRFRNGCRETLDHIVAGVDGHDHRRFRADGVAVIAQVRTVGGAYLMQAALGPLHDVRHAEGAANLDQLAARYQHLFSLGQGVERQQYRRGIVVHHSGGLGAGEAAEPGFDMAVPVASGARLQIEFQIAGSAGHIAHGSNRLFWQRGTAQVGVKHGAGQVEYLAQGRGKQFLKLALNLFDEQIRLARLDLFTQKREVIQHSLLDQRRAILLAQRLHKRPAEDLVHGWQGTTGIHGLVHVDSGRAGLARYQEPCWVSAATICAKALSASVRNSSSVRSWMGWGTKTIFGSMPRALDCNAAASMNSLEAMPTPGIFRPSRSPISCIQHEVQEPQSANPSTSRSHSSAIFCFRSVGAIRANVGLR